MDIPRRFIGAVVMVSFIACTRGLAAPSTAEQSSTAAPNAAVTVDRERERAQVVVVLPEGKLVVSLDPLTNLLLHTMNVYDLLGSHGKGYAPKSDPRVQEAVDHSIYSAIAGKENYFALVVDGRDFYAPTMQKLMAQEAYCEYPDERMLSDLAPDPLGKALVKMWGEFYQDYWSSHFETLLGEFRQMNEGARWDETLRQMERLAGKPWRGTMVIFAVEGTGRSALTYGRNVCIGRVAADGDAGFVHEGLHLLLNEEWANSARIQAFMADREFRDPFWRGDWVAKYEQALVLALEHHIRQQRGATTEPDPAVLRRSFVGCGVGDLFDVAWPLVSAYVEGRSGSLDDVMWEMITRSEGRDGEAG